MSLNFRFGVASDLHIALQETIWSNSTRFHLVEVSIPALETVLEHLQQLNLDFLLIPGDLTQDGEPENHRWLAQRLKELPFPVYLVPGNHDVPSVESNDRSIAWKDFPWYYPDCGYQNPNLHYYTCELLPGVQLIALNSNNFDAEGKQLGVVDEIQLTWLEEVLEQFSHKLILVMIHHNLIEHLPGQSKHPLGRRYMLDNASVLLQMLRKYQVKLVFTGHLHVQDLAEEEGLYEITTGSLVSYPHPYRVLELETDSQGKTKLEINSYRVKDLPGWENLLETSREWMGDRSYPFMLKMLTAPPLNLSQAEAEKLVPELRYFWADIAAGDAIFSFPQFPAVVRDYFEKFSAQDRNGKPALIDNQAKLWF
ncbi:MAG: metallophosphoesterase [Oscillatoria sp. PMC 1051.18]|nr:metallophosphoesterase [Oscillatoria sp. PMC 1050.18]MEC5032170.1 metallophosphoesterase [Oscillatoria sp. PMC 1051.18]